ncbi:MAG: DNA polymerase IV [Anaerolineae bacterium]|nr:DNA polymerase IV [Anaerolineae bacterium]
MSVQPRVIVHLDLDAFFAAVEVLEHPELSGKAVLVGGRPEERGVVASASYPARAFGVHSAMPMARALKLCPEAVVLPPRHHLYRDYSRQVMAILREASPLMEQMSIDEAYLDLTDRVTVWDEGVEIARGLQRRVKEEIGLSASLGVATNKLVAKVASDRDKPGGLTVVRPGEEAAFLAPLPVRVLWGVGPVTAAKLAEMGVHTVGELAQLSEEVLRARFGIHGAEMARRARGIDTRPVVTEHEAKSVSQERTFTRDLRDAEALKQQLWRLSQGVSRRLKRAGLAAQTVAIKLRYADFTTLTRQMTLMTPTDDERVIYRAALVLLSRVWQRGQPVRLLGVAGRRLCPPVGQLSLW